MKLFYKKYIVLLIAVGIIGACNSTKAIVAKDSKAQDLKLESSLLWEITGNGLTKPSYLFGTIHLIGKNDFFFPSSLEDKLKLAEQVTFEIDMDEMSSMESLMKIMGKAFMKDGVSLQDLLTKEEYKLVDDHFQAKGLPLQMLERMKPMLLATFATMDLGGGGMNDSKSYEMEIYGKAQDQKKSSHGLETVEDQLAIFDSIPYKAQAKMLIESIKTSDDQNEEYKMLINLYKKQDVDELAKVSIGESNGKDNYEDLFLTNRNKNWIPQMAKMMKEKSTFFAVGAAHLGGKNGVIRLLKNAGYKVTVVKMGSQL